MNPEMLGAIMPYILGGGGVVSTIAVYLQARTERAALSKQHTIEMDLRLKEIIAAKDTVVFNELREHSSRLTGTIERLTVECRDLRQLVDDAQDETHQAQRQLDRTTWALEQKERECAKCPVS